MDATLTNDLSNALSIYRQAILRMTDEEAIEDCSRLAAITDKIIAAMQSDDLTQVKLGALGFSRQVSDSFSTQPAEFKPLAEKVAEVKRVVV